MVPWFSFKNYAINWHKDRLKLSQARDWLWIEPLFMHLSRTWS